MRTVGFVLGGVGIVGLGVGTAFGIAAIGSKNTVSSHCTGKFCDAQGLSADSSAHSQATLSTVGFAVGVVALGAGAFFVLTTPSHATALRVSPLMTARGGGAAAEVTW
jgi:hypothetical protein